MNFCYIKLSELPRLTGDEVIHTSRTIMAKVSYNQCDVPVSNTCRSVALKFIRVKKEHLHQKFRVNVASYK